MIKNNLILNCPVTLDDIERTGKIYGANIAALKGKTVRTKSDPVTSDYIAVPEAVLQAKQIHIQRRHYVREQDSFFYDRQP